MDVSIRDAIWIMLNNKPKEIIITKIVKTTTLDINNNVTDKTEVYAKYSETLSEDAIVLLEEAYTTKAQLMSAIFEL
jgi:hypothetical protein